MDEYIKREDALKIIDNYSKATTEEGMVVVNAIRDIIAVITPTADVVPKSEVAMEIIDYMTMVIGAMFPNKLIALSDKEWGRSLELGREQALCDVLKSLAELKKKYTEK